jgi:hypothetical protein
MIFRCRIYKVKIMTDVDVNSNLLKVYEELCKTYRAIDEFRAKLLGFLPLASAGGIFLLLNNPENIELMNPFIKPLGLFGFLVTLGLFAYELYGIRKCHSLIKAGKKLERRILTSKEENLVCDGQFISRPRSLLGFINEPIAAGIIYPVVLAGWWFLVSVFPQTSTVGGSAVEPALAASTKIFIIFFSIVFIYNFVLSKDDEIGHISHKLKTLSRNLLVDLL